MPNYEHLKQVVLSTTDKMIEYESESIHKKFTELFLLPGADGLVPFNPSRLPAYLGGVILDQD